MKESKTYTQQEIDSNINVLSNELEELKLKRTELSKNITHVKKQIVNLQELDKKQYKIFK